jgi:hypothetical protein
MARATHEPSKNNSQIYSRCIKAPIEVKSLGLDRLEHDLSDGILSDVIGGLETHQLRLGGMSSV